MPFQNYHRHSHYSNIILHDSVATNEDYCKRAKELGHSIISSCEHGTPGNYRECAELAEKYDLRWRYVCEVYFVKYRDPELKDKTNCHLILAAKTEKGIGDINEILSEANISGYYYRPRIDMELLLKLDPKDVFVTTACVAGIWQYGDEAESLLLRMHKHFGDSLMMEVQYHNTDKQKEVNAKILSLYRKHGIPIIAGMDSHYIAPEDAALRDDYLASGGLHYEDEDGWYMDYPSDDEAYARFVKQGVLPEAVIAEALENTNVFLTFEDVVFDKAKKLPTIYPELTQDERNEKYRQLIRDAWRKYRDNVPQERWKEYEGGIAYEVNTVCNTNTSDYFLLDHEMVKRGKALGGMLTYSGRGSAGSYFTNTLLGFSSIDRFSIPVTMYPDRFISEDRLKAGNLPDIDLNVSDPAPFVQAQKELLGEYGSAPMVAYGTMKRLSAWKMYCRAAQIPFEIANTISDSLKKYELDAKHADEDEEIDVMSYVSKEYQSYLAQSEKFMGVIDHMSPHPCAYVLTGGDVRRTFGLIRVASKTGSKEPVYSAFIDGQQAEAYGYLKNDWLTVQVVGLIHDIYKRIGLPQPTVPELMTITKDDKPTWDLYAKGCTLGLNQVEREKSMLKTMRFKPKNLSELSALVAGLRPAFQSMLDKLLNREHFEYGIPALDKLLQTPEMPSSFILYQEQMMTVLQYGGFTAPESYSAIKAIAKKHPEKVLPLKERFLQGFSRRLIEEENAPENVAQETTEKVWQIVSDACSYGFNACVTGDTRIYRAKNWYKFTPTVEEMYRICNEKGYADSHNLTFARISYAKHGYGMSMSMFADGELYNNRIIDIRKSGIRDVWKITTTSGACVKCTENHKFPINGSSQMVMAHHLRVGSQLCVRDFNAFTVHDEPIVSIEYVGKEMTYDVEMEAPNHNFVLDNGLIIGNSHSVAVALDSLYCAWAKAHYPYEYYAALLTNYNEHSAKDKIAKARAEMRKFFGIELSPPRFRQDNRGYFIDKLHCSISDAISSVKGMSKRFAEDLWSLHDKSYASFADVLVDITENTCVNKTGIETLIRMGYFDEFGGNAKLLKIYEEFVSGANRYTKALSEKSKQKRLEALRDMEVKDPDAKIGIPDTIRFELSAFGSPLTVAPSMRGIFLATNVDTTYSPKITLYNCAAGTTGVMKVKKDDYNAFPIKPGDLVRLDKWEKTPAYQYTDGKRIPKPGVTELWIRSYSVI